MRILKEAINKFSLFSASFILTLLLSTASYAQIGTATPTGTFTVKIVEVLDLAVTSGV